MAKRSREDQLTRQTHPLGLDAPAVHNARTSLGGRLVALAAVAVLLVLTVANPASAHRGKESYLYLDVAETDLEGRVELPYEDLRELFGYTMGPEADDVRTELETNYNAIVTYIQDNIAVGAEGTVWPLSFDGFSLLSDDAEAEGEPGYAIFPFTVDLPAVEVPRNIDVTFTPFVDELENRRNIVLVANDWQRGVFDQEANELLFITPTDRSGSIDLGDPSQWRNFTGSIELGVDHIRTGPDHVLFVLVLLLPSVLVFTSRWQPAPSFGAALWRVLKVVSMFTVAHSITFTLVGLELIPLPAIKWVEVIIAVSIAAAAVHNLRPIFLNREWLLAFMFGLFHGLGFASLVESTLDVSRGTQLVSLLGRNVGIEIGQAIAIVLAFPALFLLRRTRFYRPVFVAGSIGLAIISLIWAVERIFEFDTGITDLILRVLAWPRVLILIAIATVVAAALYQREKSAGQLEAVAGDDGYDAASGSGLSTSVPSAN
jgi:hypothetical protein